MVSYERGTPVHAGSRVARLEVTVAHQLILESQLFQKIVNLLFNSTIEKIKLTILWGS